MGVPVVSTGICAEGLPIRHGEHLLIADTADEQVTAICAFLTHPAGTDLLAANALRQVREHCSWDAAAECFLAQCPRRSSASQPPDAGQARYAV